MLLSFIIPVYNAEQYLAQCLDSILQQPIDSFEIILIDDSSTDQSGKICNRYYQQYSNIKLMTLPANVGPGLARNEGIKIARGQYIHFMDADDMLTKDRYSYVVDAINKTKADIVYFEFKYLQGNDSERLTDQYCLNKQIDDGSIEVSTSDEFCEKCILRENFGGSVWRISVKRKLLLDNNISFSANAYGEDGVVYLKLITAADSIAILNKQIYSYRESAEGSIINKGFRNAEILAIGALLSVHQLLLIQNLNVYQDELRNKMVKNCFYDMLRFFLGSEEKQKVIAALQTYLDKYSVSLAEIFKDNTICVFIQQYGVMYGVQKYYQFFVDQLLDLTKYFQKKYLFIIPASRPNVSIAKLILNLKGELYGLLDNNELLVGENRGGWRVFSPALLQAIIDAGNIGQISVVICSSKDKVTQALEQQLEDMGLKKHEHFISMK